MVQIYDEFINTDDMVASKPGQLAGIFTEALTKVKESFVAYAVGSILNLPFQHWLITTVD